MIVLKLLLGAILLVVAWIYIFNKKLVFKLNLVMREHVFNDQVALFSGRRVALLLFVLGAVALFSGLESLISVQSFKPHIANQIIAQAKKDLANKKYEAVVRKCRELVKANPDFEPAWELMIDAYSRLGEKELARQSASVLLRINPDHPLGKSVFRGEKEKISRLKE